MSRIVSPVVLAAITLAAAVFNMEPASAQTPPPKKEAELVASGHRKLSGPEIATMLTGNTVYLLFLAPAGTAAAGSQVAQFYRDSKTRISIPGSGPMGGKKVEANWWIEGNSVCGENRVVTQGHSCASMYQGPSSIYFCSLPAGLCNYLVRVVPGNVEKM